MQKLHKQIEKYNENFKRLKDSNKDLKAEMKARIAEISQREQDIRTANMKLAKLQSDKEDLMKSYGTGRYITEPMVFVVI